MLSNQTQKMIINDLSHQHKLLTIDCQVNNVIPNPNLKFHKVILHLNHEKKNPSKDPKLLIGSSMN